MQGFVVWPLRIAAVRTDKRSPQIGYRLQLLAQNVTALYN